MIEYKIRKLYNWDIIDTVILLLIYIYNVK